MLFNKYKIFLLLNNTCKEHYNTNYNNIFKFLLLDNINLQVLCYQNKEMY